MPGEKESAMNSSLGPFYHPVKTHPSLLLSMREAELVPGSPGLGHSLRIKNHSVASVSFHVASPFVPSALLPPSESPETLSLASFYFNKLNLLFFCI